MTTSFEEKVTQRLDDLGLSMPELAGHLTMPEAELRALCRRGDPRLSELQRLAEALRTPPTYFFNGSFNLAGSGNTQKIKIGKAAAHELAAQLSVCRQALELATELVATKTALLAAKDETIELLKAAYKNPN